MYVTNHVPADAIAHVARHMRRVDREECMASFGHSPLEALTYSVDASDIAWTFYSGDEPIGIFGVGPYLRDVGSPWFLGTGRLYRPANRRFFLKMTGEVMNQMHRVGYPILLQYVDARHMHSLRWMQWAGFTIDCYYPRWGYEGLPFFRLSRMQSCVNQ